MARILVMTLSLLTLLAASVAFAQQRGGTLNAAWAQTPVGLDPHTISAMSSFQVLENVLDTLVTLDSDLNIVPSLAKSWSVSDDHLTWTFELRDDVLFSNGRPMTAEDVVYTFTRMLDPATGSGNAWMLAGVTDVSAQDEHTVTFTLDEPNPGLLGKLAMNKAVGIIAQESVEDGTINNPIGTGPFVVTDFQPGVGVQLERNEHHWREGLPYLEGVNIRIIADDTVRNTALISGDVDWVFSVPLQTVERLQEQDDIVVDSVPAGAYYYIGLNLNREPLKDPRVRQAIAHAINRENIVQAATFGQAEATQDPIPSSSAWHYGYAPYEHDPDRARELLAEAGYADGFELEIMPTTELEETVRMAQVIQADLAQVGIRATIRTLEWAEWLEEQGAGNYDTYVLSWNGLIDPDDYFYAQHRTGAGFNVTGYSNPEVDALLDQGRRTQDPEERRAIYEQVNQMIVDDAPYIYLYNPLNIQAYRPYVQGYEARPDQAIRFIETWLDR
jgi:peptide/nickel transport system substrate-binding protein